MGVNTYVIAYVWGKNRKGDPIQRMRKVHEWRSRYIFDWYVDRLKCKGVNVSDDFVSATLPPLIMTCDDVTSLLGDIIAVGREMGGFGAPPAAPASEASLRRWIQRSYQTIPIRKMRKLKGDTQRPGTTIIMYSRY